MTLWRLVHLFSALSVILANIWVSLLERSQLPLSGAPGGEPATGVVLASRDLEGHFIIWFLAGLLTISWFRRGWTRLVAGGGLIALSGGVEVAQDLMTATREGQLVDLVANTIGLVIAVAVVEISYRAVRWCTQQSTEPTVVSNRDI